MLEEFGRIFFFRVWRCVFPGDFGNQAAKLWYRQRKRNLDNAKTTMSLTLNMVDVKETSEHGNLPLVNHCSFTGRTSRVKTSDIYISECFWHFSSELFVFSLNSSSDFRWKLVGQLAHPAFSENPRCPGCQGRGSMSINVDWPYPMNTTTPSWMKMNQQFFNCFCKKQITLQKSENGNFRI